jgi:hypothetical protein
MDHYRSAAVDALAEAPAVTGGPADDPVVVAEPLPGLTVRVAPTAVEVEIDRSIATVHVDALPEVVGALRGAARYREELGIQFAGVQRWWAPGSRQDERGRPIGLCLEDPDDGRLALVVVRAEVAGLDDDLPREAWFSEAECHSHRRDGQVVSRLVLTLPRALALAATLSEHRGRPAPSVS